MMQLSFKRMAADDYKVSRARRAFIPGKKIMARGCHCLVFDNGSSVFKLTRCFHSYSLLTDGAARVQGRNFPELIRDFGEVEDGLYLYEVEKLQVKKTGEARRAAMFLSRNHSFEIEETLEIVEREYPSLVQPMLELDRFRLLMGQEVYLDMHIGNFMQRPSTGELVFSDPICWGGK